jgi:hypothetical protein
MGLSCGFKGRKVTGRATAAHVAAERDNAAAQWQASEIR